jgi:hypothetical protein
MEMNMQKNEHQFDYRKILTNLLSLYNMSGMHFKHIVTGLGEQLGREHRALQDANDELSKLREAAQRFRMLESAVRTQEESFKICAALLMNAPTLKAKVGDGFALSDGEVDALCEQSGLAISPEELDIENYPLWKVIREVLKQTSEIRIYELESHLKTFGVKTSRSAIESAIITHKKEFKVTKRGREKFVALKGV